MMFSESREVGDVGDIGDMGEGMREVREIANDVVMGNAEFWERIKVDGLIRDLLVI